LAYEKIKLENNNKKAFIVLMETLKISMSQAQQIIDKKRLFCNGKIVEEKNAILQGLIELIIYKPQPKGIDIVFENEDFAVLEKESGILSHPNGRNCTYSLCDEIWHLWGTNACVAHRLDKETSGLILVAKHKNSQILLKTMFEKKQIQKEYLALVSGKTQNFFTINLAIDLTRNYDDFKTRMQIYENGKNALTEFKTLEFWQAYDASLVLCRPKTGRQHQIRVHLFHIKHKILGDCLYGLNKKQIEDILDNKLNKQERVKITGASRLLLHSCRLKFTYKNQIFDIYSKKDIKQEFKNSLQTTN